MPAQFNPTKPSTKRTDRPKPSSWQRRWRYYYWKFIRLRSTPKLMARGLAIGVFVGMFPMFGLQTLMAVGLATIVRGNKWLAAIGTWISNPVTDIPIVLLNIQVGRWLLQKHHVGSVIRLSSWQDFAALGSELITVLLTGCLVTGSISAIIVYIISIRAFQRILTRHYHRRGVASYPEHRS
jgi:uncharacterized protein (DUF2062 family)